MYRCSGWVYQHDIKKIEDRADVALEIWKVTLLFEHTSYMVTSWNTELPLFDTAPVLLRLPNYPDLRSIVNLMLWFQVNNIFLLIYIQILDVYTSFSHSCCNLLHPRIFRSSLSSSSRWAPFQNSSRKPFLVHPLHVAIPCLYLILSKTEFLIFIFSLITLFIVFIILTSRRSPQKVDLHRHKFRFLE